MSATSLPKNYEIVRRIVERAGSGIHLRASDIFTRARAKQSRIGFSTVHRALTRLVEQGAITRVTTPDGDAAWYECAAEPHAHLVCHTCGAIEDVDYRLPAATIARVARTHHIEIATDSLTFGGACRSCVLALRRRSR